VNNGGVREVQIATCLLELIETDEIEEAIECRVV
jgi:hypothetical protein